MEMEGGGGANLICMYDRMYAKGREQRLRGVAMQGCSASVRQPSWGQVLS